MRAKFHIQYGLIKRYYSEFISKNLKNHFPPKSTTTIENNKQDPRTFFSIKGDMVSDECFLNEFFKKFKINRNLVTVSTMTDGSLTNGLNILTIKPINMDLVQTYINKYSKTNLTLISNISESIFCDGIVASKAPKNVLQMINVNSYPHFYDLIQFFQNSEILDMVSIRDSHGFFIGRILITIKNENQAFHLLKTKNGSIFNNEIVSLKICSLPTISAILKVYQYKPCNYLPQNDSILVVSNIPSHIKINELKDIIGFQHVKNFALSPIKSVNMSDNKADSNTYSVYINMKNDAECNKIIHSNLTLNPKINQLDIKLSKLYD